jgi:glyoxylase I family protein
VHEEKRMQLRGLHHVTAICRDLERTIAFYRDLLGLAIVHDGPSDDDPETRHVWFGALDGEAGRLVSFMQYPELPKGVVGVGSTHHFALLVESAEEQEAWRDYLRGQGVECTDVFDRGSFRSIYVRDPDGHIVEIATRGPGFGAGGRPAEPRDRERAGVGDRRLATEAARQLVALALRHRPDRLGLEHRDRREEAAAAGPAPAVLAHEQIGDGHALRLPRALEHDLGDRQVTVRHLPLELRSRQPHAVRSRERLHVLGSGSRRDSLHWTSPWHLSVMAVPFVFRRRDRARAGSTGRPSIRSRRPPCR